MIFVSEWAQFVLEAPAHSVKVIARDFTGQVIVLLERCHFCPFDFSVMANGFSTGADPLFLSDLDYTFEAVERCVGVLERMNYLREAVDLLVDQIAIPDDFVMCHLIRYEDLKQVSRFSVCDCSNLRVCEERKPTRPAATELTAANQLSRYYKPMKKLYDSVVLISNFGRLPMPMGVSVCEAEVAHFNCSRLHWWPRWRNEFVGTRSLIQATEYDVYDDVILITKQFFPQRTVSAFGSRTCR